MNVDQNNVIIKKCVIGYERVNYHGFKFKCECEFAQRKKNNTIVSTWATREYEKTESCGNPKPNVINEDKAVACVQYT